LYHFGGSPSVLDDDHVFAFGPLEAEFGDGRGAVGEQALLVIRVGPCAGDDLRAVHRAEVVLEVLHDLVERIGVEDSVFDEHRLDRGDAGFDRRHFGRVMVVGRHRGSSR
jgi:hypothetical protein